MKRKRNVQRLRDVRQWAMTAAAPDGGAEGEDFHAIIAPEGEWSSDGRMFAPDSLAPREGPNLLPLMGLVETTEAHERAVSIGHFTRIEKIANAWHGWGVWSADDAAVPIIEAIERGDVTGVSVDAAVQEWQFLVEASKDDPESSVAVDSEPEPVDKVTVDGVEYDAYEGAESGLMMATEAEILGATVVPFPAFGSCTIEVLRPPSRSTEVALTAGVAPVAPPPDWFELPGGHRGAYDVVIEGGRIHGYPAASWSDCHLSFPDECVTPPRSITDYAYFKVGSVRCSDGSIVKTGPLTLRGGHADRTWSAARAMAHYDDTDSAFADVAIGEDSYGIWIAGALRPNVSPEEVRTAMASGFSGDWRMIGGNLELIALSAVNTPGFRRRAALYEAEGLVASALIDMPRGGADHAAVADAEAIVASAADRIAASIGRSKAQRFNALRERVHGKVSV